MNLVIPNNIFSTLFVLSIPEQNKPNIIVDEASLIINHVQNDEDTIGLIPSLDLINNSDLFVSKEIGMSFFGNLSNSYLYFSSNNKIDKLLLKGDLSKNEIILGKIAIKELYGIEPEFNLVSDEKISAENNYLISGSENWLSNNFKKGMSFNERISEYLEYPYVNFVFVAKEEEVLKQFNEKFTSIAAEIKNNISDLLNKIDFDEELKTYLKVQINSMNYKFTELEMFGLTELYKLIFYHQIIDDIFDIKFV